MQRFKIIDFVVIEVCFFKKMKNMDKSFFRYYVHLTPQHSQFLCIAIGHILHLDIIKTEINFKLKVKMQNILMYNYGFQWE